MLSDALDRVWNCIHQMAPDSAGHKKAANMDSEWKKTRPGADIGGVPHELPDAETLEEAFRQLLDELDLSPEKEKELDTQSPDKKWTMILEQSARQDRAEQRGCASSCAELMQQLRQCLRNFPERYAMPLAVQQIESLSISLRTESFSFVQAFLEAGGASLLVALLNEARRRGADALAAPLLGCFRALLNSSVGRNGVLESDEILLAIAGSLDFRNAKCKILVLEILSAMCLVAEGGHRAVLNALTAARTLLGERVRFQTLVDDLHREHERSIGVQPSADRTVSAEGGTAPRNRRDTERVRIAIMSLVNALLKSGHAEQSLEFRLHLRYEFLMLGIQDVIDRLRREHGSVLADHFDLFEMMRQEDEHELTNSADSGSSSPIDFESPADMAEALSHKLDNTLALPHLISLLQHLLMVPGDEKHIHLWRLFDLMLQQLSLQSAMGSLDDNVDRAQFDQCLLRVNMADLIARLRTEHECERLEKELAEAHAELDAERRHVVELENRVSDLQDGVSLSSFSRVSDLSSSPSDPCHSPTFFNGAATAPPPPPPIVKSFMPPPPPPPPTAEELRNGFQKESIPQKKIPKPSGQLRSLNWTKIPYNKIAGTIWENMEDEKLYKYIDLNELATSFASSATKSDDVENSAAETLQRIRRRRTSLVTVIDARRAQNCTIMLSKLKLSHREIRHTVLTMDERRKLPKDMIEQMLKFIPTKEEIAALRDAVQRHKSPTVLALADRFLYEIAQVPRYEQRLRCLLMIRTFQERLDEILPYLNSVIRASNVMMENKKIRQFLGLILAIGNYLNYGKRIGNTYGFAINSLGAVHGVKSSLRSDRNLMHFIVEIVEEKFPNLLKLRRELSAVYDAAKYSREEMDAELRLIEISLREMAVELATAEQKNSEGSQPSDGIPSTVISKEVPSSADAPQPSDVSLVINEGSRSKAQNPARAQPSDQFIPVVRAFLETARKSLYDTQRMSREMEEKLYNCTKLYGVETDAPKKCSPDEFFGSFSRFFTQFVDCQKTLWAENEEIERVKRQTLVRSIFTKKGGPRGRKQGNINKDFESLVNALQSGEIFSEDLNRLRTSIRVKDGQRSSSRRRSGHSQYESTSRIEINGGNVYTATVA